VWIRDREYDSLLNAYPHLQMVTAGFGFSL
jgi:hypothetical protein